MSVFNVNTINEKIHIISVKISMYASLKYDFSTQN